MRNFFNLLLKIIIFPFKFIFITIPKFLFTSLFGGIILIFVIGGIIAFCVTAFVYPKWWPGM